MTQQAAAIGRRHIKDARAEARRQLASRARADARGDFYAAVIAANAAVERFGKTMPRPKAERLALRIGDILHGAYRLLPDDVDLGALAQQIADGTVDSLEAPAVSCPAAHTGESEDDATARILVERGFPQAAALRAVFGEDPLVGVQDSAALKRMNRARSAASKRKAAFQAAANAELPVEEQREWERIFAEHDRRTARNRPR